MYFIYYFFFLIIVCCQRFHLENSALEKPNSKVVQKKPEREQKLSIKLKYGSIPYAFPRPIFTAVLCTILHSMHQISN